MPGKRIDNRDFIVNWMRSESVEDVARLTGQTKAAANAKAVYLRKMGVKVPGKSRRMSQTARDLEVAQLNSLIKRHSKENS